MSVKSREREFKRRIASGEYRMPTYDELAVKLQGLAEERSEWAGIPMMLKDFPLTLEPRYPYQMKLCKEKDVDEAAPDIEHVNSWWNDRLATTTHIVRVNGKLDWYHNVGCNKLSLLVGTLGASQGWLVEAEAKAQRKLGELISEQAMRCYFLTGTFLERSKRSGVYYIFRKLRPTITMTADKNGNMLGLCALCAHPIGYYQGSHSGAMVPTDDVIAHLVCMRGDEHYFWRISNQHPLYRPEAHV